MRKRHATVAAILLGTFALQLPAAFAQMPPHAPGTICATPRFWCWALYKGPPGTQCACRTQSGWVAGILV